jgi:indole-3-glycerol phosphate synthase
MTGANYLDRILERKRQEVVERKMRVPVDALRLLPAFQNPRRSLRAALASRAPAVIAEIKGASPSKGIIRENIDPRAIAGAYARNGAAAISVLTDEPFFNGSIAYLPLAREGHSLPILRKDFIIDPYQLYEARAFGADAVLLIVAALDGDVLRGLHAEAGTLGLEVMVEVHNEEELAAATELAGGILGINNRDLSTFRTTLDVTCGLSALVPGGTMIVSESGIQDARDVRRLREHGVNAMLIGEAFMRAPDPGEALRSFLAACGEDGR